MVLNGWKFKKNNIMNKYIKAIIIHLVSQIISCLIFTLFFDIPLSHAVFIFSCITTGYVFGLFTKVN